MLCIYETQMEQSEVRGVMKIGFSIKDNEVRGFEYRIGASYYGDLYQKTYQQWEKFITGAGEIDRSIVPEDIASSWEKCREMGLDPYAQPQLRILPKEEIEAVKKKNETLIAISRPFLLNLYRFVKGSRFVVALFDRDGVLLEVMQDVGSEEGNKKYFWFPGVQWTEGGAGNNAAATVLALKKPIRIFATQHYLRFFHHITASSAPIFGPDGEIAGGIALTAFYYGANPHTLGMAVAAASAIENGLKAEKALEEYRRALHRTELAYGLQKAIISSIPEALVAIDSKGSVMLINEKAREKFFFHEPEIEGKNLGEMLERGNKQLKVLIENNAHLTDVEVRINTPQGPSDFSLNIRPIFSSGREITGKLLILTEIKRIGNLVTKMIGAKAKFNFADICGQNPRFLQTVEHARLVSQNDANVLLLGESGTGKDIFAQAIHNASDRRNGPYLAINCAAIPRDLISSELFGYSDGAFTGSRRGGNRGKFELVDGGTIFLDEIAEIPLELQAVLLRVIEDKSVVRIGGTRVRPVNVRVIAATNKDLLEEVRKGNFRKDLYYRLNVFTIHLPPLTERMDDIPILTEHFIKKYEHTLGKKITRVDDRIWEVFFSYPWPGNVRELQNVVERMMHYARGNTLSIDLVPPEILDHRGKLPEDETPPLVREEWERAEILRLLKLRYPKKKIAEMLRISRTTLFRRMKYYRIDS